MKEFYQQTKEELLQQFHVTGHGLSGEEAKKRLVEYGKMSWRRESAKAPFRYFLSSFATCWW